MSEPTDPLMRTGAAAASTPLFNETPPATPPSAEKPTLRLSTCKGCGRPILWAKLAKGSSVPLDPKPATYIVVEDGGEYHAMRPADLLAEANDHRFPPVVGVYVSHFATCPKADLFSSSGKKGGGDAR